MLDLFSAERPEWGVREAASELGISKSSAHDLLASLAGIGLLRRVPPGRYRLGWRTVAMGTLAYETSQLRLEAAPAMRLLGDRYQATVQLATLDRNEVVCLALRAFRSAPAVVEVGATAKVLVAHYPWHEPPLLTSATSPVAAETVREELREVQAQGFAWAELGDGCRAVAAPITDCAGAAVAAMTMSGRLPGSQVDRNAYSAAMVAVTTRVSRRLRQPESGERPPYPDAAGCAARTA